MNDEIRKALFGKTSFCIDMKNCYPTMLFEFLRRHEINPQVPGTSKSYLEDYIVNRDVIL
jgi:hypothetical protein